MDSTELDAELDDGEGDAAAGVRRPVNPLIWVVVALSCVVVGFFLLSQGGPAATPSLTGVSLSPMPRLPPSALAGPGQRQYIGVARICGAITDHRSRLAISFEVQNVSSYDVSVTSVKSVLPLGELRPGRITGGGDCVAAGTEPVTGPIPAQRSKYFTLNFGLPKTCPATAAVLVRINFLALGFHETSLSILESDLAIPDFDSCPKTPTTGQPQRDKPPKPVT